MTISSIFHKHQQIPFKAVILIITLLVASLSGTTIVNAAAKPQTIVVSAEGLADPDADIYQKDKGLMIDHLRQDARRQVIEKAVGAFVESATLSQNYVLIEDRIMTHSKGLIKQVIKVTDPWRGKDGFMHMLMKAEVYLAPIKTALEEMSRTQRVSLLKQHGNPRIAISVLVKDAQRSSDVAPQRSAIAENILKERISKFGYRVWSQSEGVGGPASDFLIQGEAKFKKLSARLKASGITITKYALTSWTVKCIDSNTDEELYFNNKIPRGKSWSDEDVALEDIGHLIAGEFSKEFFELHLMKPSKIYQLEVAGLPDYDIGTLFKKEMIGLRAVLNVDFRKFNAGGRSLFEVEFAGNPSNFLQAVNSTVIAPLNQKFGHPMFKLISASGELVVIDIKANQKPADIVEKFESTPPASLAAATPQRLKAIIKDVSTMAKLAQINPGAVAKIKAGDDDVSQPAGALGAARDF